MVIPAPGKGHLLCLFNPENIGPSGRASMISGRPGFAGLLCRKVHQVGEQICPQGTTSNRWCQTFWRLRLMILAEQSVFVAQVNNRGFWKRHPWRGALHVRLVHPAPRSLPMGDPGWSWSKTKDASTERRTCLAWKPACDRLYICKISSMCTGLFQSIPFFRRASSFEQEPST